MVFSHLLLVYLVTALVPSDTACLANSPGNKRRTAVCTSRLLMVDRLLQWARRLDSAAILSNRSLTKLFMMDIALLDIPVSGCTCFSTLQIQIEQLSFLFLFLFLSPLRAGFGFAAFLAPLALTLGGMIQNQNSKDGCGS